MTPGPGQGPRPSQGAAPLAPQHQDAGYGPAAGVAPAAMNSAKRDEDYDDDEDEPRSGWLMVAAALFVFVILGAGGLFAYNNQKDLAALVSTLTDDQSKGTNEIAVVRAPREPARENVGNAASPSSDETVSTGTTGSTVASLNNGSTAAPKPQSVSAPPADDNTPLPDLPILKSEMWKFAEANFSDWAQKRRAYLRELASENKTREEANKYLVESFVRFRRDNSAIALMAAPDDLRRIATAFVASLKALTVKGADACYAFVSNGESTPEVAPLYFEPQIGEKIEIQMLAIMQAIASGKSAPSQARKPPTAEDFNKLSTELGKRGWTSQDLRLFSDPKALSQAEPKVVCRLVTEWFSTQTTLADAETRDQLIAASLRPVIGG